MQLQYKVDVPIMSQPILWVINASVQLLGQRIVPYEKFII